MIKETKIKSIKKIDYDGLIYTPGVEDNFNYFLGKDSPILSKNCQHNSQISSKLLATRMGENTKLIVLGDIAQVDNPHTSKYNNAITFLVDKAKKPNDYDVVIRAIELNETVRSKTARFADKW